MAMASSPLPLSSRDLNRSTPTAIEKKTSYKSLEIENHSTQERENLPLQASNRSPSSPIQDLVSPTTQCNAPNKQLSPKRLVDHEAIPLTENALRENEGLTRVIQILEEDNNRGVDYNVDNDTLYTVGAPQGYAGMDDTGFTTFSAVPNADMTLFAQVGQSPTKSSFNSPLKASRQPHFGDGVPTPRHITSTTPATARSHHFDDYSPSPTPRRPKSGDGDTTNLILDFTEQFNAFTQNSSRSPSRSNHPSPRKIFTQPDLASYASGRRTPSPTKSRYRLGTPPEKRHFPNLLDFDLTPAPTPRSVPSVTARELESLKSSFLSQVSSLRANLSGKEAEVNSLKEAVTDAERRVGEALEQIRDEKGTKEILQAEKVDWEIRDKEMQKVLRNVKEEIIRGDRERDQLQQKLDESKRKREDADAKVIEAQSKIAGLEARSTAAASTEQSDRTPGTSANPGTVEAAVEKVAKELHSLYRHKHEVKVAALKESYKARWERKIRELETRIDQLSHENEDLRLGKDTTMSGVVPSHPLPGCGISQDQLDEERTKQAQILAGVQEEVVSMRHTNTNLLTQLEKERQEMADLVAATEEMMQLSLNNPLPNEAPTHSTTAGIENLRGSISRAASGLKGPGFGTGTGAGTGESRIGRMGGGGETRGRGGFGGTGGRSGIMGNIERMGRGRVGD